MPSRWWVSLPDLERPTAKIEHVHAAFSAWFDRSDPEHRAGDKPYTLSPVSVDADGTVGVEVATMSLDAEHRLRQGLRASPTVRLGRDVSRVGEPQLVMAEGWDSLGSPTGARSWRLDLVTPTTFRSGDRASPLPHLPTILRGLSGAWTVWAPSAPPDAERHLGRIWVSDIDVRTEVLRVTLGGKKDEPPRKITVPGAVGVVVVRASTTEAAAAADCLLRLARYCGIGSMTRKGFGVAAGRAALSKGRAAPLRNGPRRRSPWAGWLTRPSRSSP